MRIEVPNWVAAFEEEHRHGADSIESRMQLAIALSRQNVERGGGGPFGAAIFDAVSGALIAAGVNLVVASRCSHMHAEMVALARAQEQLGSHDLSDGDRQLELLSSAEPCAMCMGAIPWSGVVRLGCAARDDDIRAIGFDEGCKPSEWVTAYEDHGIDVIRDLGREEAVKVLQAYARAGGEIY